MGVDLGGAEPHVTQRGLHDRERRDAGEPRRERMAEGVRGTVDVEVSPLPVAVECPGVLPFSGRILTRRNRPSGMTFVFAVVQVLYLCDWSWLTMNGDCSKVFSGRVEREPPTLDLSFAKTLWTYGKNADLMKVGPVEPNEKSRFLRGAALVSSVGVA